MNSIIELSGRWLLALMFLLAGLNKIPGYAGTQDYMEAMGVPGALLPLVILLEIGGALALMIGWKTRWAALGLALFTIVAALVFHAELSDRMQMILFMKNWAIAGGLLLLTSHGAGSISLDARICANGGK